MGSEVAAAFLVATITFILTILVGPRIVEFLATMGRAILFLPIIFVINNSNDRYDEYQPGHFF